MLTALGIAVEGALALLSLRRVVLLVAAIVPGRAEDHAGHALPSVTVMVPAHNEEEAADELLSSLAALEYAGPLFFLLVCDGCTDETPERFRSWSATRPDARTIELDARVGKARALNVALGAATGDVVVVLDADLRARADLVRRLAAVFDDQTVGAAAGYIAPQNATRNLVSRYAALNSVVHQLATSAGKDRLGLNPPTLGASAYRRSALVSLDGFAGGVGEDVDATVALTRAGWRTRFVSESVAENHVVETLHAYWQQHVRWTRATLVAGRTRPLVARTSLRRRSETWILRIGDGDRVIFSLAVILAFAGAIRVWVPIAYLVAPGLEIVAATIWMREKRNLGAFLASAAVLFPVDVAASVAALLGFLARRPTIWHARPARLARRARA